MTVKLPALREELRLNTGALERDGSPTWIIHDPPANRFYRIGWLEFEVLSRWLQPVEKILRQIADETTLRPTVADLERVVRFLQSHNLLRDPSPGGSTFLRMNAVQHDATLAKRLLHNYLFFRIPLLRPDRFLDRLYPVASPLLSWPAAIVVALVGLLGLFLAIRQWDSFVSAFINTLTPSGFLGYTLALITAKCLHELGHALMAKRLGVRIPRMGVAFLVMFPVLYIDTNESWYLTDNRQRLLIAAGGLLAEGALASVALLLWGLTADGPLRDAWYFIAVVSVFRSLLVNSSPFLRFDGYYLLSDFLDMPNLQQRAFALTCCHIRRLLFATGEDFPEHFSPRRTVLLVSYSIATWLYRLVVFLGIAFAVYRFFFKPLGIFLMLVEICYFIFLPIAREVSRWRKAVPMLSRKRRQGFILATLLLAGVLFLPFRTTVRAPALLTAAEKRQIFSPFSARVDQAVADGAVVRRGALLFKLTADEALFRAAQAGEQAAELRDRVKRFSVSDKGREQVAAWRAEAEERELDSAAQRSDLRRLAVRAEFDGVMLDVDDGIRPGVYVSRNDQLGVLVNPSSAMVEAFIPEEAMARLHIGGQATFFAAAPGGETVRGKIAAIDLNRVTAVPTAALADKHGGEIATRPTNERHLVPAASLYRVRITPDKTAAVKRMQIGYACIEVDRRSLAGHLFRQALSVLVRESGF
jgi:putative peptide zinc metalloprotease protein